MHLTTDPQNTGSKYQQGWKEKQKNPQLQLEALRNENNY